MHYFFIEFKLLGFYLVIILIYMRILVKQ